MSYDVISRARIIADWLGRRNGKMSVQDISEIPAVVGTAVGEVRKENQDRVAVARFGSAGTPDRSFLLLALCDGIGGMKHGAQCAELAVGTVIDACIRTTGVNIHTRLQMSIEAANQSVYREFKADGGTTIAAVLISRDGYALATVGDSRIYTFDPNSRRLQQLSQDDTVHAELKRLRGSEADSSEQFLGHLTQFVGIGSDLEIRLYREPKLSPTSALVLTSDGVHSMAIPTMGAILRFAPTPFDAVTRLLHVARWCGGQDNASTIYVLPEALGSLDRTIEGNRLEIWDSFGSLAIVASNESVNLPVPVSLRDRSHSKGNQTSERRRKSGGSPARSGPKTAKRELGPTRQPPTEQRKLEIELSSGDGADESDARNLPDALQVEKRDKREGDSLVVPDAPSKPEGEK